MRGESEMVMKENAEMLAALYKDPDGETVEFSDDLIEAIGAVCRLNVEICRTISDGTKKDALMYLKCMYYEAVNLIEWEDGL